MRKDNKSDDICAKKRKKGDHFVAISGSVCIYVERILQTSLYLMHNRVIDIALSNYVSLIFAD